MAENETPTDVVRVKSPTGEWGTIPKANLDRALESGYSEETPQQKVVNDYVAENQGAKGALKVGVKSFLNQLAFDVPDTVEEMTGAPLERAKTEALKKEHRLASVVGDIPGFVGSMIYGGPVAGAAGKAAGRLAESLLARTALKTGEKALATAGVKSAAKEIASRAIVRGAELGVEGAAFAAPVALTEAVLGDPELAAETVAINGIVGGSLGAILGSAGATKDIVSAKAKPILEKSISKFKELNGVKAVSDAVDSGAVSGEDLIKSAGSNAAKEEVSSQVGQSEELKKAGTQFMDMIYGSMKEKKITADQITEAAKRQGIDILPGMTEKDPSVRQWVSRLETSPTLAGKMAFEKVQAARDQIQNVISKDVLGMTADDLLGKNVSKSTTGEMIKNDILSHIKSESSGFKSAYEQFKEPFSTAPIHEAEFKNAIQDARAKIAEISDQEAALKKDLNSRLDVVEKSKSISQLNEEIRTLESKNRQAKGPLNPDRVLSNQLDSMISSLKNVRDLSASALEGDLGKKFIETQSAYRETKKLFAEIAEATGVGKTSDRAKIVEKLSQMDPSTLIERLSRAKNNKGFQFLAENMPDTLAKVADYVKTDIATRAAKDGAFNVGKTIQLANKYNPEVIEMIFGKNGSQALKDIKLIADAVPKWMESNPSGTAIYQEIAKINPINMIGKNATDLIHYNALFNRDNVALRAVEQTMKKTAETLDKIPDIVTNLSKNTAKATSRIEIKEKAPKKIPAASGFEPKAIPAGSKKSPEVNNERQREIMSSIYRVLGSELQDKAKEAKQKGKDPIRETIESAFSNPDIIQNRLKDILGALSSQGAEQTSQSLQNHALNATKYLYDSLPKPSKPRDITGMSQHVPSDYEMSKFAKRAGVVADPMIVLKKLENGELTRDHVDAISKVYPKVYDAMRSRVLNYLTTEKPKLSYQGKAQLCVFLQTPIDQSMLPDSVLGAQKIYAQQDMTQENQQFKPVNFKSGVADRYTIGKDKFKP